jgi:SMODS and SLOG-associating 2TM effector domain 3/SMODS and SLOG-associating 2TM effector domain 1
MALYGDGVGQQPAPGPASTAVAAESEFPPLYRAADQNSLAGQRRFLNATRLRLAMLVVAAAFGLVNLRRPGGTVDFAGVGASVAFVVALLAELYLLQARPDRLWYDGRAVAESAKTLTWRYLVGGDPFGLERLSDREADKLLIDRFRQIAGNLTGTHLVPIAEAADQISPTLRRFRSLPLSERRELYRTQRIGDQQAWYARTARWNERRATQWSLALTTLEALGLAGGLLKATGVLGIDLLGLAGAVVAAGAAWVQAKQHQNLANAYAVASQELAAIRAQVDWASGEKDWAHFVDQAEEAISREHTLWRASRT